MTEGQQTTRFDWKVLLIGGSSAIGNTPRHVIGDTSVLFALARSDKRTALSIQPWWPLLSRALSFLL